MKNAQNNFKITFTNLNTDGSTLIHSLEIYGLPLFAFNSTDYIEDDSVLTTNNKFIGLNQNILKELTDIYTNCNCQNYKTQNWNIKQLFNCYKLITFLYF